MFNWKNFEANLRLSGDNDPLSYNLPDLSIGIDRKSLNEVTNAFEIVCEEFDATRKPAPTSNTSLKTRRELANLASGITPIPFIDVFTDIEVSKAAAIMYIAGRYGFCLPGVHIDFQGTADKNFGILAHSNKAEFYKGAMALAAFYNTSSAVDAFGKRQAKFILLASECGFYDALSNLGTVCAEFARVKSELTSVTSLSSPSILLQMALSEVRKESQLKGRMPYAIQRLDVSGSSIQINTISISDEEMITPGLALSANERFLNEHIIDLYHSSLCIVKAKHVSYSEQAYELN